MTDNRTTELLRKLLDERGVEYETDDNEKYLNTLWNTADRDANPMNVLFQEPLDGIPGTIGTWTELHIGKATSDQAIAATLDGNRESELQAALNKAAGKWAKSQERVRELERMLLIDDGTVEDYTERSDLLAALKREKDKANEFHTDWKKLHEYCAWLEGENAKWQAYCEELEKKLEIATLESGTCEMVISGTLTAEQVRKAVEGHGNIMDNRLYEDWQAVADELNAELGSRTCHAESDLSEWVCSACQCWIPLGLTPENIKNASEWRYCPHCGTKVVS